MTSQSYILTLFSDKLENGGWKKLHDEIWAEGKAEYLGSQLEKCPNSGKLHWQAFIHFTRQTKQRGTYFKHFDERIHWEKCSHLRAAAISYGIKEESRVEGPRENGKAPSPKETKGKIDWDAVKDAVLTNRKEGVSFEIVVKHHLEQRWDSLRSFYVVDDRECLPMFLPNPWGLLLPSKKLEKRRHYWIWSSRPNLGKTTKFAKPLSERFRVRVISGDTTYFDVALEIECMIFDEFNHQVFKYSTLNSMCDGTYSYRRFYKKSIVLRDPLIIVLSNCSLKELFPIRNDLLYERFREFELV